MKLLWQIFVTFFKIGPVTFGGGYAMIPLIEREIVDRRKWVKLEDVTDIFAVAESVPGAIAINSATFIGYRLAGVFGAIVAMIGILLPTFIIILTLSLIFLYFKDTPQIEAAFIGIRPAIVALITFAAFKIADVGIIDRTTLVMAILTVLVLLIFNIHPIIVIISGLLLGVLFINIKSRLNK